jgi:hypothetical protein
MIEPIALLTNASPSYRMLQALGDDFLAFATTSACIIYNLKLHQVTATLFLKDVETGPCTALNCF